MTDDEIRDEKIRQEVERRIAPYRETAVIPPWAVVTITAIVLIPLAAGWMLLNKVMGAFEDASADYNDRSAVVEREKKPWEIHPSLYDERGCSTFGDRRAIPDRPEVAEECKDMRRHHADVRRHRQIERLAKKASVDPAKYTGKKGLRVLKKTVKAMTPTTPSGGGGGWDGPNINWPGRWG